MHKSHSRSAWATILLAVLLVHSLAGQPRAFALAGGTLPTDLADSPSAGAMLELKALGILAGYGDGTYRPDALISRAEFCAMVVRAFVPDDGGISRSHRPPFADVQASFAWAYGYINTAVGMGIVAGDPDGSFRPGAPITGAEAAAIIARVLGRERTVLAGKVPWPDNYLKEAETLGIWPLVWSGNQPLSRGVASEALVSVLRTADNLPVGTPSPCSSALTRLGVTEVTGEIRSVALPPLATRGELSMADGTIGRADGKPDLVELLPDAVVHGVTDLRDLKGRIAHVLVGRDGKALYVSASVIGRLASSESLGDTLLLTLVDGSTYRAAAARCRVTVNHQPAQLARLKSGMEIALSFGAAGALAGVDAYADLSGTLANVDGAYHLTDETAGTQALIPPAPTVAYILNGKGVTKAELDAELARAGQVYGTAHWDRSSGSVAAIEVRAFDNASTVRQPVLETGPRSFEALNWFTVAGAADIRRSFAPSAVVLKDGMPTYPASIHRGDIVSFRTNAQGDVTYLEAATDTSPPAVTLPAQINTPEQYTITFDEAIDLSTLELHLDDVRYGADSLFLHRLNALYSPETRTTTVTVLPSAPLSESVHELRLTVSDIAGNRRTTEATFYVDTTPMVFAGAEWGASGRDTDTPQRQTEVCLYFIGDADDQIDQASAKDLKNWTFIDGNPANGVTRIIACTHAGYYVTLVLDGPVDPASRLRGEIRDNAGNNVIVDAVYGE